MRLTTRSYLGIEITDQHVKIAEAQLGRGSSIVSKALIAPINPEWMDEGKMVDPASMALFIRKLLFEHHINVKNAHFTVPSQHILVRFLKFPDIPDKDLRKVVTFEVKHNVHLPFENPYFDFARIVKPGEPSSAKKPARLKKAKPAAAQGDTDGDQALLEAAPSSAGQDPFSFFEPKEKPSGAEGDAESPTDKCEVMLVAAPSELVEQYMQLAEFCGLTPLSIEIKALSVYRLLEHSHWPYLRKTFVFVDINASSSDVSVFAEGVLRLTRSVQFPFGEQGAPAAPAESTGLFAEFASPIASEFDGSCRDLGNEIERVMNFYKYSLNNRNQEFDYVLIAGDIDRLPEVRSALAERLNQPVGLLDGGTIRLSDSVSAPLHALAVPVGLALRGKRT